ncbi:hypothetical protein [Thiomicrorhabdus aquaedulcis]|uniref:hypothetical protein n=1 Tax=Thiomicrorhabdus aquaedulcis TaxID=2211106 RepID=UPI001561B28B|nr:hypothetical protein [Thiomicrorhabdus aquaedulcis]
MFKMVLLILVLTVASWLVLKLISKPMHIGLVLLFWIAVVFGSAGLLYGFSVWQAGL